MPDTRPLERTDSFEAALADLAQITGVAGEEQPSDLLERTMVGFYIGQEWNVIPLIRQHQDAFLARGCFICHYCGCVAAVPTNDPFRAVEEIYTSGDNWKISNHQIVAWLRETHSRYPLRLTSVGDDEIKGDFLTPIADPEQLAQSIIAICPTWTDGVEKLAKRLKEERDLFLWWD